MTMNVKPIYVTDTETGAEYTLEFSRESVMFAERRGFDINDAAKFPMTAIYDLWFYAFRMHHRNVSRDKADKLLDAAGGFSDEVMSRLGELYSVPFESLSEDNGDKNPTVTIRL